MKKIILTALLIALNLSIKAGNSSARVTLKQSPRFNVSIPVAGNTYSSLHQKSKTISKKGIENWTNPEEYFTVYFKIDRPGSFQIYTQNTIISNKASLSFEIDKEKKQIVYTPENSNKKQKIGNFKIDKTGYIALKIKAIHKNGANFPSIGNIEINSKDYQGTFNYIPNDEDNFFYWGRRGPSVHLNYLMPDANNTEWFYNEVTVPEGNDVIGSYYMANGFGEGYFGMQVNSENERRILFSVWSPFNTNDPKSIPTEQQIQLLKKGEGVYTGEFGNEGSGRQSYLRYNWKAGTTYKFLLHGTPNKNNSTNYTAYFYAPEKGEWLLIASFKRPQTNTYLKRFHSFLENFSPNQGDINRKVLFNNQWVCDENGKWTELNKCFFTYDNTAKKTFRMDYKGGLLHSQFFLENCGFFNESTTYRTEFERPLNYKTPEIDFSKLP